MTRLSNPGEPSRRKFRRRPTMSRCVLLCCLASSAIWLSSCGKETVDDGRPASGGLGPEQTVRVHRAAHMFFSVFFNEVQSGSLSADGRRDLRTVTTAAVQRDLVRASQNVRPQAAQCRTKEFFLTPRAQDRVLAEAIMSCGSKEVGYGVEFVEQMGAWVVRDLRDERFDRRGRCIAVTCRPHRANGSVERFGAASQDEAARPGG